MSMENLFQVGLSLTIAIGLARIASAEAQAQDGFRSPWERNEVDSDRRVTVRTIGFSEERVASIDNTWKNQQETPSAHDPDHFLLDKVSSLPLYLAIRAYQKIGGANTGGHCPMYPSCSTYGIQVLGDYGLFQGIIMIGDRLNRCSHDVWYYRYIEDTSGKRYYDPPIENTLRWYKH